MRENRPRGMMDASGLEGAELDAAVARAEGKDPRIAPYRVDDYGGITFVRDAPVCIVGTEHFEPSTNWQHGGPIIQRERIVLVPNLNDTWWGRIPGEFVDWKPNEQVGRTPLIAAMRAFVASKQP